MCSCVHEHARSVFHQCWAYVCSCVHAFMFVCHHCLGAKGPLAYCYWCSWPALFTRMNLHTACLGIMVPLLCVFVLPVLCRPVFLSMTPCVDF